MSAGWAAHSWGLLFKHNKIHSRVQNALARAWNRTPEGYYSPWTRVVGIPVSGRSPTSRYRGATRRLGTQGKATTRYGRTIMAIKAVARPFRGLLTLTSMWPLPEGVPFSGNGVSREE